MTEPVGTYPFKSPTAVEPPPEWAWLRQRCPVAPVRLPSGDEAVLLTRYDSVRRMMADPRFTRELSAEDAARISTAPEGGPFAAPSALEMTGEGHRQWRRLVIKWFTVRRMAALRARIEDRADTLIDAMHQRGAPVDLVRALAFPLPVWVICELLGVPDSDRDRFAHWAHVQLSISEFTSADIAAAQDEFDAYMSAHLAAKRAAPGDDLLSELIAVRDSGDGRLSEEALIATGQGLLVAGHETTSNMISKMVLMLLADRRHWEELLADFGLVDGAVEEALRYDLASGFGLPRYLTEDVDVEGAALPRGTTVVCGLGAANRDERVFDHAERVDLRRSPNPHLAFGAGPHACLGQALARTELRAVLGVLLRRLPTLDLAAPAASVATRDEILSGGIRELLVRW
ncbi:cytochrome P450 [Streptomyces boncukensis]|uniref:Cytochrome P450 n=1 Tax=Streptomyces boncukensis TaxID=2711219 RepID=A0A6G4WUC4_9ACTN|nr:cytochrome P450 [Streptomyces boncukensis]NGO68815.1 cytochrome P450 [Streptomyces boncukensis]